MQMMNEHLFGKGHARRIYAEVHVRSVVSTRVSILELGTRESLEGNLMCSPPYLWTLYTRYDLHDPGRKLVPLIGDSTQGTLAVASSRSGQSYANEPRVPCDAHNRLSILPDLEHG